MTTTKVEDGFMCVVRESVCERLMKSTYVRTVQYTISQYTVQYSILQYSTVQYSTVQYSTVQYSTVQYSTVQISTVVVQCSTEKYLVCTGKSWENPYRTDSSGRESRIRLNCSTCLR